jgi:Protein of unknown function (DUF664)
MYAPAPHDEITTILNYVDQQLTAIRAAVLGLTEDQATATPCRSTLSVAGIIKHTAYGMRGAVKVITDGQRLSDQETAEAVAQDFDVARQEYLAVIAHADPDADILREQIDGLAVPALVLTVDGAQANEYFQPFEPQPGTIGASS